jgi:hypothetical protein
MKPEEMDILLEKFYNGETTPQEEELIQSELSTESGQDIYAATSSYMKFVQSEKDVLPSDELESKILESIQKEPVEKTFKLHKLYYAISSAAAIALIALGINYFNGGFFNTKQDDLSTQQKYDITMNALMMVSDNLNKGMAQLENLEKINKNFQKMNKLQILQNIEYIDPEKQTSKGESL